MRHLGQLKHEAGMLLVELMIALTLLTVGILGYFASFATNFRAADDVSNQDDVRVVLNDLVENLQNTPFDQIYSTYNYTWLEVPSLPGSYGYPGWAYVHFHTYEPELAYYYEFGPIMDIDGQGGLDTADASTNYKLLPTHITVWYMQPDGMWWWKQLFVVLRPR